MNIASPISTWFGGNCCVPSACRSSASTMTMRVKLVIISRIAGARERTVSRMTICIAAEKFSRLEISGTFRIGAVIGDGVALTSVCAVAPLTIDFSCPQAVEDADMSSITARRGARRARNRALFHRQPNDRESLLI